MERMLEMFPNDEGQAVDAAREHIEEASIADGLAKEKAPAPGNGLREEAGTGAEAAMEHVESAAVADGLVSR